jgi:DNA-binding XRE family transcriptional regulator
MVGPEITEQADQNPLGRAVTLVLGREGGKVSGLRPQIDTGLQTHHRHVCCGESDDLLRDLTHTRGRGVGFGVGAVALEDHAFRGTGGFKVGGERLELCVWMRGCFRQNSSVCPHGAFGHWILRNNLLIKPYDFDIDCSEDTCQYQKYGVIPMELTAAQCRAARGLIGWSQQQLATASKVAKPTIANFEAGKSAPYERTTKDLIVALESAGVIFVAENGDGPGVRLRKIPPQESIPSEDLNASNDE